ncbi:hypothetical protein V8B97DRAFT_1977413 [Scleroderma yunnanense]
MRNGRWKCAQCTKTRVPLTWGRKQRLSCPAVLCRCHVKWCLQPIPWDPIFIV